MNPQGGAVPPPTDSTALDNQARIAAIDQRVSEMEREYLAWARSAKRGYHAWNFLTIVFSAAVPVVVLIAPLVGSSANAPWVPATAGILGALATLAKSIDSIYKNHDTWLRNNSSYGKLSSERFLFQERAGPYKNLAADDRISTYAERVNAVIGAESESWTGAESAPAASATS
jgi:hypothetical protein